VIRDDLPLAEAIRSALPHVPLAELPTPVQRLDRLSERLGVELWAKRDDLCSPEYGGNKVRKFEHLLAAARDRGARSVITFGAVGSNHVTATALFARRLGLHCAAAVFPQPMSGYARENLRADQALGVRLAFVPSPLLTPAAALALWIRLRRDRDTSPPYLVAPGGSTPLGTVGMVAAACELAGQVRAGMIPEPDRLYVPLGSCGTAAGLAAGVAAAGLRTQVIAVRVVDRVLANAALTRRMARRTAALLRRALPGFPEGDPAAPLRVRHEQFGRAYAHFTRAGQEAVRLAADEEGLALEGTYSGKALAALVADARAGALAGRTALFWITCNGQDLSALAAQGDPVQLPPAIRREFEKADHVAS